VAGKLDGKVAFITGAARGQGRCHAVRLAADGADIIAVDICRQIDEVPYPMATPEDLDQTVKEVEALGQRIVARQADVRDEAGLRAAFDAGVSELGPAGIVVANALPVDMVESADIAGAVAWLVSEDAGTSPASRSRSTPGSRIRGNRWPGE